MSSAIDSLLAAFVLAGVFIAGNLSHSAAATERFWTSRRYVSAAAGISVAYIFVDVLPELELQRRIVAGSAGGADLLFTEKGLYLLALASFVVFYGLEHMVLVRRARASVNVTSTFDPTYITQLTGYIAYSTLIGYLLDERADRGTLPLVIYTFAMAVHFLVVDHALDDEHHDRYAPLGRWLLAASIVVGWFISTGMPLSELQVARLFAVLAGGVVITSLRAELPDDRNGRFWPFCLSALSFAGVLILT
jgi:hypothetical protein